MSNYVNQRERIDDAFVSAVFNIDVEEVERLLKTADYDKSLFDNVCLKESHLCPINWITQFWEIILAEPETWRKDCQEKVSKKKRDNQEIKKILTDELGVTFTPIEFKNNDLWIYDYFSDQQFDEIFDFPKEEMLSRGHKAIDIDLYCAITRYDFEETEKLLQSGANPNYNITEESECCFSFIEGRCAFYDLEIGNVLFENRHEAAVDYRDLANLMAWGINEKMFNLLAKYVKPKR